MALLRAALCPGLSAELALLLRARGVRTVVDFVSSDLEDVAQKCSLSYKALVAVRRVLLAQFSAFPANGADLYEELKSSTAILSTGIASLDKLLDSGLYTGEVTELMGAPGSGKTQVCLSVAASVSLGLKQHVLFLDSTGGFTASRLYQMLQARAEDEEEQLEALQRVQVARAFDIYEMLGALQELRDSLSQQARGAFFLQVTSSTGPLKVLLIDSVSAVIYPLLGGKQSEGSAQWSETQQRTKEALNCICLLSLALMMQLARELKMLAREFSLAVVVTNQVTRNSSTGPLKPALGRSWSFVPSTRVLLESKEATWEKANTQRIASLVKSSRQPTGIQVELDIGNSDAQELSPVTPTQGL
ncbi:DNA repair protein RAD51 homolog 4 isoform X2 [Rhea pennata]|uniref:DNA repair protein RAD51 homolog 4 isoform X2 n=1 Tax=Rhea pennata TaxID=8795 RepID=UPI002E264733